MKRWSKCGYSVPAYAANHCQKSVCPLEPHISFAGAEELVSSRSSRTWLCDPVDTGGCSNEIFMTACTAHSRC